MMGATSYVEVVLALDRFGVRLRDDEWSKWSNRKIATVAKVDHKTVAKVRQDIMGGEFPTRNRPTGEIPTQHGKPSTAGSVVGDLLRSVSTEALVEECGRRGLVMEAPDV